MSLLTLLLSVASILMRTEAITITDIPSATTSFSYSYTVRPSLSTISYSYPYTVTTPTTQWQAPTFATPTPVPACDNAVCPTHDGQSCIDGENVVYGILCNTLLSGIVITNSGKFMEKSKRSYTGSFEGCTAFCGTYNDTYCVGVMYEAGYCQAYDSITGNFPNPAGGFAAIRQ